MSETNLLLCPFCGIKLQCKGGGFYFHGKADCVLSEFEFDGLSEKDWNTRTQPNPVKSTDSLMTFSYNIVCKILEAQHTPVMTKGELSEYVFSQIRDFIKPPDVGGEKFRVVYGDAAPKYVCNACDSQMEYHLKCPKCDSQLAASDLYRCGSYTEIVTLVTQIERMRGALELIEACGRPHGGKGTVQFPDGCECEQCSAWDDCKKALKFLPPSQFVLIERSELEKWPCGCFNETIDSTEQQTIKCHRCLALEKKRL